MKQYVINKNDLIHNIDTIKEKSGTAKVIAVLKGNGYGLGICEFADVLKEQGIDYFAVSEVSEAEKLRKGGFDCDILLITATADKQDIKACVEMDVILSAGSETVLNRISDVAQELDKTARVHLKTDTGFGRFGFSYSDGRTAAECVKRLSNIMVEGAFSHFSFSFSDKRKDVQNQYDNFITFINDVEENGVALELKHICNSCAFVQYPDMHLNAVRIGSAFLGRLPLAGDYNLKRIGLMRSRVVEVKTLPKGHFVGYANTYTTKRETKIAIIPVGYKDGFGVEKSRDTFRFIDTLRYMYNDFKMLGSKNTVNIGSRACLLIGRISMCNVIADVTGTDIKPGDSVELNVNPLFLRDDIERIYE